MKAEWWRSWHGAPTDPKWLTIGARAKVPPGVVAAVAWALFDRASSAEDRGSIAGFDPESLAHFFGFKPAQIEAIVAAMREKGVIAGDRIAAWEKRQPKQQRERAPDPNVGERVRRSRERNRPADRTPEPPEQLDLDCPSDAPAAPAPNVALHHVTPCNTTESESEERERRETGTARAREEACEPSPGAKRAEERALEAECQRKVEGLPVSASANFVPVLRLLDQGMTRADILAGIDAALGKGVVPRGWSVFENFIREAAKDRLERALPPRLRVVASGAGPPGERQFSSLRVNALVELAREYEALEDGSR